MRPVNDLAEICRQFRFEGSLMESLPVEFGHINDTFLLQFINSHGKTRRYILQRINQVVFRKPEELMQNIERVTGHLHKKILAAGGDPQRETLNLVPTLEGKSYFHDSIGDYWRAYLYIEGARTYEIAESPQQVYHAAWAFGNFQRLLADFPASELHETIPNFHHTPRRFKAFLEALQRDPCQRAGKVQEEIQFVLDRKSNTPVLVDLIAQNQLPLRVTHNDTKFNNVMIDDQTGESICIIDLDTVMPGSALYDFGDAVRSAAALSAEDEPDTSRAGISLRVFDRLAHGYLNAARDFLTGLEIQYLAFAAQLITLEQAIRFLMDFLNGDVYYKIHRPEQNLDRARTQIKMVADMEGKSEQLEGIIAKYR